jgi:ABC-type uncharacterized transport system fused permease/ATPase subunit
VFEDAVVVTPGNTTLVHDLSLRVPSGTNLLVTGPNGAGKSSLFRWGGVEGRGCVTAGTWGRLACAEAGSYARSLVAYKLHACACRVLGGLWPLTGGRIYKPGGGGEGDEGGLSNVIFYVPQRPYVTQGSLQEQLIYPLTATEERRIPEDQLRVLLGTVDLEYLLDRQVVKWVECTGV